ncbi:MAG: 1-deoxy-D-xylulose-5-phosphate reductoisomerase [Clostridia bacterium]|nr:1-deoxy-D-xylulose-5-phosphate reductoisomerase [Clostridia bacterium]
MKLITVLGSTGSIGTQTLDAIRNLNKNTDFSCRIVGLSTNINIELLEKQIREFNPIFAAVIDKEKAKNLLVNGIVGTAGLLPTVEAIKAKKTIALANKETLVTAGDIIMKLAKDNGVKILPLDSEHSAVFQCLQNLDDTKEKQLNRILLTASGGPFFGKTRDELKEVKKEQALKHPNWSMGAKITIDSATMMNKGLEIIEAVRLFNIPQERVDVLIHRESIIHSMVEFIDYSILAQMNVPDMKIALQYALTYPDRMISPSKKLDLASITKLTFYNPDNETFKSIKLCREAIVQGGTAPTILNAANEIAVEAFLNDKINFLDITDIVEKELNDREVISYPSLESIFETDLNIRKALKKRLFS